MIQKTTIQIYQEIQDQYVEKRIFIHEDDNKFAKQVWFLKEGIIKYLEERKELYRNYCFKHHHSKDDMCSCIDIDTELTTIQLKIDSPQSLTEQNVKDVNQHDHAGGEVAQDSNKAEDIKLTVEDIDLRLPSSIDLFLESNKLVLLKEVFIEQKNITDEETKNDDLH